MSQSQDFLHQPKIPIVFIINSLERGGAERMLVDLVTHLSRDRFAPSIICVLRRGVLADEVEKAGIPVYNINKRTKLGIWAIVRMTALLLRLRPAIVHTHLFGGDFWGRIAAFFARIPIILSTEHNLHTLDRRREYWSKRLLNCMTDAIVFISEAAKKDYNGKLSLSRDKQHVIHNGIVWQDFFCQRKILQRELIEILVVARLVEQKGHIHLIRALSQIRHLSWQCRFVGGGHLMDVLKKEVQRLGLTDRIVFLGEQGDVASFLWKADLFILPSLFEGQGIVLLEAACAGMCIVSSNCDGIPEIFRHQETAVLVDPGKSDDIAQAIIWVHKNRSLAQDMAQLAQQEIVEKHDVHVMVEQYKKLYETLLSNLTPHYTPPESPSRGKVPNQSPLRRTGRLPPFEEAYRATPHLSGKGKLPPFRGIGGNFPPQRGHAPPRHAPRV